MARNGGTINRMNIRHYFGGCKPHGFMRKCYSPVHKYRSPAAFHTCRYQWCAICESSRGFIDNCPPRYTIHSYRLPIYIHLCKFPVRSAIMNYISSQFASFHCAGFIFNVSLKLFLFQFGYSTFLTEQNKHFFASISDISISNFFL